MRRLPLASSLALLFPAALPAQHEQDLITVNFAGAAGIASSRSSVSQPLGPTGATGHNGMARQGRDLYATEQVGAIPTVQRFLCVIDDVTGASTRVASLSRDLRALSTGVGFELLGIADRNGGDELVRVSIQTGAIVVVGSTGFSSIQGLTLANGVLYAWDLQAGLLRVDPNTGAATDVNPNAAGTGTAIQFLTTMSDGRILGGQGALFSLDPATGLTTFLGDQLGSDVRGAEERFGVFYPFGRRCGGIALNLSGDPRPGGTIATNSTGHPALGAGFAVIGFSDTSFLGLSLPLDLDPLIGTIGCLLYTSLDLSLPLAADAAGVMSLALPLPLLTEGLIFHLQHMTLGNAARNVGFTNAGTVRVAL